MSKTKFPSRFLSWTGSRDLAVKRPFALDSEVPTETFIKTNLTERLENWSERILEKGNSPNILFLVGGPGNGKSAALEYGITKICSEKEELREYLREQYSQIRLPRKVEYDIDIGNYNGISIVQDATIPQDNNVNAEEALISDIKQYVIGSSNRIYFCCINRGILAQAISRAYKFHQKDEDLQHFLEKVMESLKLSNNPIATWPLEGFPKVGVWPMDIESLVDPNIYTDGSTPFHQILDIATDKENWTNNGNCNADEYCPFELNRKLLSQKSNKESLIKILRFFELKSGKRWNFRELFALSGYLFIGNEQSFQAKGENITPCEWANNKVLKLKNSNKESDKINATFQLCAKLYYHNLFPKWPNLDNLAHQYRNKIHQRLTVDDQEYFAAFHSIFSTSKEQEINSDIFRIIIDELNPLLDPGIAQSQEEILDSGTTLNKIEYEYSHSVTLGNEKVSVFEITQLEKLLLKRLEEIEDAISNAREVAKNHSTLLDKYDNTLKTFGCRFIKRNIGSRFKIVKDHQLAASYNQILTDPIEFAELIRVFERLLMNNSNNLFEASLVTTFGQPQLRRAKDIFMQYSGLSINTETIKPDQKNRPKSSMQFFIVEDQPIALTFDLYSALKEVDRGLEPTSLDYEIYALLDSIRSKALGRVINNKDKFNNFKVRIGQTGEVIDYHNAIGFSVREDNNG